MLHDSVAPRMMRWAFGDAVVVSGIALQPRNQFDHGRYLRTIPPV